MLNRWVYFGLGLACLWLGLAASALAEEETRLRAFARQLGLADVSGFVDAVQTIDRTGKLPARYVTKAEADRRGWRPGQDLCRSVPGGVIGGDRFGNREGRLPAKPDRRWTEADLDYACGRRGPKRLVFSDDGLRYVTVDHYATFYAVPR
jgi:hypothetical protein